MTSQPSNRSKKQIIQDIEHITRQPGFIYSLAFLCYRDLFLDQKGPGEELARFPFLPGIGFPDRAHGEAAASEHLPVRGRLGAPNLRR